MKFLLPLLLLLQLPPPQLPPCPPGQTLNQACVQDAYQDYNYEVALIDAAYSASVQSHYDELTYSQSICGNQACLDSAEHVYNVQMGQAQALHNRLLSGAAVQLMLSLQGCCQ